MKLRGQKVRTLSVDASNTGFIFKNGAYVIDHQLIARIEREDGVLEEEAELIYHEGDPLPDGSKLPRGEALVELVVNEITDSLTDVSDSFVNKILMKIRGLIPI